MFKEKFTIEEIEQALSNATINLIEKLDEASKKEHKELSTTVKVANMLLITTFSSEVLSLLTPKRKMGEEYE